MTDVTVTLTDHERWALDAVIVMAIEGRPIPDHWRDYVNALPAVSAKLRSAQPAEARCAILESKWNSVPWEHIKHSATFTDAHGSSMARAVLQWLDANRPKETDE